MGRSRMAIQTGGIQAAINYLSANETPQLLIVEASETGDALFERIEALAEVCDPNSNVILVGAENDISLYRQLKDLGLAEYFCGSVTTDQIIAAIDAVFGDGGEVSQSRVITFMGSRGGVGSSVLAANVAYQLGQQYKDDVLLIDCDLNFGTAALTCNAEPKQTIADILAQPGRLDDTLVERVKFKIDDFMSMIPAPSQLAGDSEVPTETFETIMRIARGMASFVVLDLPHLWAPWIQDSLLEATELVLVTTPDLPGMRDVKNLSDAAKANGAREGAQLVLNKVGMSRKTEISAKDFDTQLGLTPAVSIPFDPLLFGTAMNNGEFLAKVGKNSKAMVEIGKLVELVSGTERLTKAELKARAKQAKSRKKSSWSVLKFAR